MYDKHDRYCAKHYYFSLLLDTNKFKKLKF